MYACIYNITCHYKAVIVNVPFVIKYIYIYSLSQLVTVAHLQA